jgi:2-polyprenyl-6-methoxyphenol hydroxylase-like FAD-dependent oxidoreductase/predicted DsbA family dithiol-disulfide isomerase
MKVVIIGGGIAGLTLGIFLNKRNIDVVVNERSLGMPTRGHAFLMHTDGLSILNNIADEGNATLPGKKINAFSLRRPNGNEIKHLQLNSWQCIKRRDLIKFLFSLFPKDKYREGRLFSHFVYKNGQVIGAAFLNGVVEYGDIFVGADGGNSMVRELIFGKVHFTPVMVKEVVGITAKSSSNGQLSTFTKFQNKTNGLAFGVIPTSEEEFVWFMQYDPAISDVEDSTPEELKAFCNKLLKKYPAEVTEILSANDFTTTYIWNTRDFDMLPSFHKQNVVLIGDAAHLALPFTSAGTTNAIVDAKTLTECLISAGDHKAAFEQYYHIRSDEVAKHINLGRELKKIFLNPQGQEDDDIPVPLIAHKKDTYLAEKNKQIQVLYFTDPICSTCWIIQPLLRKLELEYGKYLNIEYCMGGLLPSWEQYNSSKIRQPSDAAKHWEEVCALHEMPLDGDVWIEDPLTSSYPPSIAFKAAQMQDTSKAILFLRRIKEMVFLEKKNIIKWDFLRKAAFEVGLDSARLLRDFEGRAKEMFREDLVLAERLGVTGFPTLFFSDGSSNLQSIKGFQPYENFEAIIYKLIPTAKKETIDPDPKKLFTHFPTMTDKEFGFLSNISRKDAISKLAELYEGGNIDKYESKNGIIWTSKFSTVKD